MATYLGLDASQAAGFQEKQTPVKGKEVQSESWGNPKKNLYWYILKCRLPRGRNSLLDPTILPRTTCSECICERMGAGQWVWRGASPQM